MKNEYKAGDKVELNCSKEEFRVGVLAGEEILIQAFSQGIAEVSYYDSDGDLWIQCAAKSYPRVVILKHELKFIKIPKAIGVKLKSAEFKNEADMAEFLLSDGECFNKTGEVVFVQYGQFVVRHQAGTLRGGLYELANFKDMQVEVTNGY